MSDKNVCPYCGGDVYAEGGWVWDGEWGFAGECSKCTGRGIFAVTKSGAIAAFTHPAHLMESLHTYDPQTQIVVSREAGKQIKTCVGYYLYDENGHCDSDSRCVDAYRELCAAMEATHERDE